MGNECICKGNFRDIVAECDGLIGKQFKDRHGNLFNFFGVVWGEDDLYYGMSSKEHGLRLLSCVGNLKGWEYSQSDTVEKHDEV